MNENSIRGAAGEYHAARYYREQGYVILTTNYRTRQGELDIVAQKGDTVAVVEVKLRAAGAKVTGREAVTPEKQRRLTLAAQAFLQASGLLDKNIRFDVAEVVPTNKTYSVVPVFGAFDAAYGTE